MENNDLTIVIYGAGAIGSPIAAFLSVQYNNIYLLARGENAKAMKQNGMLLYQQEKDKPETISIEIIEDLNELKSIDIIIITVKNYDLEEVAKDISERIGDKPIIVALQNGTENQRILPMYFTKVIYGVIVFSAWKDEPGIFGYREKGQILLGTLKTENQQYLQNIIELLKPIMSVKATKKYQDAIHSKLVLNLANSIFSLIENQNLDFPSYTKFIHMLIHAYYEGIKIIQAAGHKEHKLKGLPTWAIIETLANSPDEKAAELMSKSKRGLKNSMVQDMIIHQRNRSELESLNGYLLKLAEKFDIDAPYNRIIYDLCKKHFTTSPYKPLDVITVWNEIRKRLEKNKK